MAFAAISTEENGAPARPYRAYLLRCWLEAAPGPGEFPAWHFAVLEAGTPQPRGFARLDDVNAFIASELARAAGELQDLGGGAGGDSDTGQDLPPSRSV